MEGDMAHLQKHAERRVMKAIQMTRRSSTPREDAQIVLRRAQIELRHSVQSERMLIS